MIAFLYQLTYSILSCSDEEGGIELQILSNAIGGSVPADHSSRTSVEHHSQSQSDELSCANSAVSVDFPEQLASTIGMYCGQSASEIHNVYLRELENVSCES